MPLVGAVIEDKRVHADAFRGVARRLARSSLDAALDRELAPLTNVRLRLSYPDAGGESGDVYGKVTGTVTVDGAAMVRIHLTSVDATDQAILAQLRETAAASGNPSSVSNRSEASR